MRKKADGTAFEKEFSKCFESNYYVRRLPTLNTGYAGQTQPADFVVVGEKFNYVELKETTQDSFSITSMQQYPEMEKFLNEKRQLMSQGKAASLLMRYWVIVHFLDRGIIKAIAAEKAMEMSNSRKALRYDTSVDVEAESLEELRRKIRL